tara:strand:- start:26384 stop:27295 length:912 start_codon:yes stop_codon:yes gene_type:complete
MIIARLKGGIGNQMFIYALARHLAIKNNTKLKLDLTYMKLSNERNYDLKYFNIPVKEIPLPLGMTIFPRIFFKIFKILSKKKGLEHLYPVQKDNYFDESILKKKVFILDDYWQCEDYFKDIGDVIRKDFMLKPKSNEKNRLMLEKITNSNSICVHVRRGDIAEHKRGNEVGRLLSINYQKNAIKLIKKKVKNPHFFVFSDGLDWVKENLKINSPTTYVDINNQDEAYKDFNLMKHCKHFVIAHSSFSWWAAWLSENKGKIIIAPKTWLNPIDKSKIPKNTKKKWPYIRDEGNIIPQNWIRVES